MHKKTRKLQYYHIKDKDENNKRIKRNKDVWLVHQTIRNRLDLFMNRKTESKLKQLFTSCCE